MESLSPQEHQQVLSLLGSLPFLQRLPGDSFQEVVERAQLRRFGVDELVVRAGEPGEGLYVIWKGKAEVLRTGDDGTERHLARILTTGDHFGHVRFGPEKQPQKYDIVARSEISCVVIRHEQAHLLSPASTWRHPPGELSVVERLLQLEFVKDDIFQANPIPEVPSFWGNMYGGRMVGLALGAACKTVDPALVAHSLHSYFILGGIASLPVTFKVERIRSGHTFATRHVQATQKGKVCFAMYASFQRIEDGLEHQYPMPPTASPNELPTYEELLGPLCDDPRKHIRQSATSCLQMGQTLDLRYFNRRSQLTNEPQEPRQRLWVRTKGKLGDDQALHRSAAGYAFDWSFLETAMMPHSKLVNEHPVFGFSIDHSIWFHRPFRADEYLLFVVYKPYVLHLFPLTCNYALPLISEILYTQPAWMGREAHNLEAVSLWRCRLQFV
ncbi:hypothetical protein KC19_1G186200 [Ceratodon purpureus]|uniref:Cyclic nucleotide-binding domain-containing protein n=1 Tax=Ceratodon purpureus TaxID=3225 RepID=A0A8T0J9Q6_CERPU|nr:hypothetical protein KC19_1G186200 [Ceratodon purpureus]